MRLLDSLNISQMLLRMAFLGGALALLVTLACVNSQSVKWDCPANCTCGYDPRGENYGQCPRTDPVLFLPSVMPNNYVYIRCTMLAKPNDYELLGEFNIGYVTSVNFVSCPLPNQPYMELMNAMNISGAQKLSVQHYNMNGSLHQSHLSGLKNIKRLFLASLGLEHVPKNLLQDLSELTMLDLKYNSLKIPDDFFQYVPKLQTLELSGNKISHLSSGIFKNLTSLISLSLWSNNLKNLTRDTFEGLSYLETLDLNSNGIETLKDDVFANLRNLKTLLLYANNFSSLPEGLFRYNPELNLIRLHDNRQKLRVLPDGFVANLTNLQVLQLHRSYVTEIPSNAFQGCFNLTNITLYGNNISILPENLFKDTRKLQELDLSKNKIVHLPENLFSTLSKIVSINLGRNKITRINQYLFEGLQTLQILKLNNNGLEFISESAFEGLVRLKEIDLSNNKLTLQPAMSNLSPLRNCRNLQYARLNNNSISMIFEDWFLLLANLRLLDLSYNKLSYITVDDINFIANYVTLDIRYNVISTINLKDAEKITFAHNLFGDRNMTVLIEGNPLSCDCNIYHLVQYLQNDIAPEVHKLFQITPGNLSCAFPPEYVNFPVKKLQPSKLVCGLYDSNFQRGVKCPNPCICYGRPYYDKALIVNCSNSGLREAPRALPFVYPTFNKTELWMSENYIQSLPNTSAPGYENVTFMDVSHNNISHVILENLPRRLKELHLNNNNITHLGRSVLSFLTNRTEVSLEGNPWSCDCENRDLLLFLQAQYKKVFHLSNITCADSGLVLAEMTAADICPEMTTLIVAISVTVALTGIFLGSFAALYYRYRQEIKVWLYANNLFLWLVTEEELDKDKVYDAFISYSHKDEDFVINDLVPGLENIPNPFKLCLHYRDWLAGEFIPSQIANSVQNSRRTVVVLSPNFVESVWGRMEFRTAHKQALSEGRARVIVLIYGDIGPVDNLDPELKAYLTTNTYVKWGDPWFWDKLRYALPHRSKTREVKTMNRGVSLDKMELVYSSNQASPTTPPVESIINSILIMNKMKDENTLNGDCNNSCVKSV